MALPKKIADRLSAGLRRFQPILQAAKARDINESDTVVIVMDLLQEVFGYDKYSEITSEQKIRGTYCDLAVKVEGSPALLIEVKSIGLDLKDQFVKQAVDYAANQGVDWVVLTNGGRWQVYKVSFAKPIEHELVVELDLLALNPKSEDHLELVNLLAKEGWQKARLGDYHSQRQILSRFSIAAIVQSDPVVEVVRRELRRLSGVKVEVDEVRRVLENEVLKREVLEDEKAAAARRLVGRAASRSIRSTSAKEENAPETSPTAGASSPSTPIAPPPASGPQGST